MAGLINLLRRPSAAALIVAALLLGGCAAPQQPATKEASLPLPPAGQDQALALEAEGNYLEALTYWRNAQAVVETKISALSDHVANTAASFARQGVALFQERQADEALAAFFRSLRFDPANETSLHYVTAKYEPQRSTTYTVKEGDTFATIAQSVYGSALDSFIVAHYSGKKTERDLVAGERLELPVLDSFLAPAIIAYNRDILEARALFHDQRFETLLPLAQKLVEQHPHDEESSFILNSTLLALGRQQREQGRYEEAAETLARIDRSFINVEEAVEELRLLQLQQARESAARRNRELVDRGKHLISQQRYAEALQVLQQVDRDFPGITETMGELQRISNEEADRHYKQGLALFVEDKLPAAISEWQKALRLNPDHPKAADDMASARRLLQKLRELDTQDRGN